MAVPLCPTWGTVTVRERETRKHGRRLKSTLRALQKPNRQPLYNEQLTKKRSRSRNPDNFAKFLILVTARRESSSLKPTPPDDYRFQAVMWRCGGNCAWAKSRSSLAMGITTVIVAGGDGKFWLKDICRLFALDVIERVSSS